MELKCLLLGLAFSIGIFALKNGVGVYYFLTQKRKLKARVLFFSLYGLIYLAFFLLSFHILQRVNIIHHFETVQTFLKSGMFIHVLMAGGLVVWGIILLKKKGPATDKRSSGWMALVIPCPVCVIVIFFSTAFLLSYFPDSGHLPLLAVYSGFMIIVVITAAGMTSMGGRFDASPESTLGAAMLIIAFYFLLSIIIMPQFGDMDKIYRLAACQSEKQVTSPRQTVFLYFAMSALFAAGFTATRRQLRRKKN